MPILLRQRIQHKLLLWLCITIVSIWFQFNFGIFRSPKVAPLCQEQDFLFFHLGFSPKGGWSLQKFQWFFSESLMLEFLIHFPFLQILFLFFVRIIAVIFDFVAFFVRLEITVLEFKFFFSKQARRSERERLLTLIESLVTLKVTITKQVPRSERRVLH